MNRLFPNWPRTKLTSCKNDRGIERIWEQQEQVREGFYTQEDWVESSAPKSQPIGYVAHLCCRATPFNSRCGIGYVQLPPQEIMAAIGVPHSVKLLKQFYLECQQQVGAIGVPHFAKLLKQFYLECQQQLSGSFERNYRDS